MTLVLLFLLLLILTFGVLLYFLKPSRVETAVKRQLASIGGTRAPNIGQTTILRQELASSAPWLDRLLGQAPGASALSRLITQSGKRWPATPVVMLSLLGTCLGWWLGWLMIPNLLLSFGIGVIVGASPYVYLYVLRELRFRRCGAQLPEAVDLMSRALRAGHAVPSALEMVGNETPDPLGAEFRTLHEEQRLGLPTRDAFRNLVERVPQDDMRFLATAILVQSETGGNLTQILDKTAAVMRERQRLYGQIRIYTAQGRITGWILCLLPFIMFGLIHLINPAYEKILITDPTGLDLAYAGLAMMVAGVLVIRKIIAIKV